MEWTEPDNMLPTDVYVKMPSFTLQEKYDQKKTLTALGITDLFSDKCDLSGMAPGKLKLSETVHECVVDVDEKGTDAEGGSGEDDQAGSAEDVQAGSAEDVQAGSGGRVVQTESKEITESFIVKSPFLFFIRHNSTKSILFWGRVTNPHL